MNAQSFPYSGILTATDGAQAVAWVETHIAQGACAYPITPSTGMGTAFALAVANGKRNLWDETLFFLEPESEHSAASACEGFALAGGRVTNFTSGQGLILMKEVLYTIAGKRLPVVFHIGARAVTSQSLNIHAGHDDVMAVADTGFGILFARNVQEAHDLALIARRTAETARTPFLNVQDGFLTTHTLETVRLAEPPMMADYIGHPRERLISLFDPGRPLMTGAVQNQDAYMKGRIAQRNYADAVSEHLRRAYEAFYDLTGRRYGPVGAYRLEDAEYALVGLGSMMETATAAVDWMRAHYGWKVGLLHLTAFRPFPAAAVAAALSRCRAVAVLERTDIPLAKDNPLTLEIKATLTDAFTDGQAAHLPRVFSGVCGLGGRAVRAADLIAATANLIEDGKRFFVLGIPHSAALQSGASPDLRPAGAFSVRGHSLGGYGSITTAKVLASLMQEMFGLYVQAYPKYGSDKKGLPTTYYLTAAAAPIREHAESEHVDFISLHHATALHAQDALAGLLPGGSVYVQSRAANDEELWAQLPQGFRRRLRALNARLFYLDAQAISNGLSPAPDLRLRMQGIVALGAFLRVAPPVQAQRLAEDPLFALVEAALRKYFGRRGERAVQDNLAAVRSGYRQVREVDPARVGAAAAEASPLHV